LIGKPLKKNREVVVITARAEKSGKTEVRRECVNPASYEKKEEIEIIFSGERRLCGEYPRGESQKGLRGLCWKAKKTGSASTKHSKQENPVERRQIYRLTPKKGLKWHRVVVMTFQPFGANRWDQRKLRGSVSTYIAQKRNKEIRPFKRKKIAMEEVMTCGPLPGGERVKYLREGDVAEEIESWLSGAGDRNKRENIKRMPQASKRKRIRTKVFARRRGNTLTKQEWRFQRVRHGVLCNHDGEERSLSLSRGKTRDLKAKGKKKHGGGRYLRRGRKAGNANWGAINSTRRGNEKRWPNDWREKKRGSPGRYPGNRQGTNWGEDKLKKKGVKGEGGVGAEGGELMRRGRGGVGGLLRYDISEKNRFLDATAQDCARWRFRLLIKREKRCPGKGGCCAHAASERRGGN